MNTVIKKFLKDNFIKKNVAIIPYVADAIIALDSIDKIVSKFAKNNMETFDKEPGLAINHDLYRRAYDYIEGALVLIITNKVSSSEVLCRTSIESSINLHFICSEDNSDNLIAYFKQYIKTERRQNINWSKASKNPIHLKDDIDKNLKMIEEKELSLDGDEIILKKYFKHFEIDFEKVDSVWPSIFDRFRIIGKEFEYRTIYASLCSQAHNDPEDSLNNLALILSNSEGMKEGLDMENYLFSTKMILHCIHMFIEASMVYISRFGVDFDFSKLFVIWLEITDTLALLSKNKTKHILHMSEKSHT